MILEQCNILVFPCGSEIGIELFRALKDIRFVTLYGASSVEDHGMWLYQNYAGDIPFVTEKNFIEQINACVDQWHIDYIFPAMDSVILKLSECRNQLHAGLLTSPAEAVRICRSKSATYQQLKGCPFLPRTYSNAASVDIYPALVKPAVGQGAKGVQKVNSLKELEWTLADRTDEQVICEYLPGEEYTVDCFTDRHRQLLYSCARVRSRIRNGISVHSTTVADDQEIKQIAEEINRRMLFRGAWFFQLKRDGKGQLKLLECATRIAGTMCTQRAKGINLPLLTLMDAMDMDISIAPQVHHVTVDRALYNVYGMDLKYDELYIDFDDTIVVHGHVNRTVMALMYQCVERGIPITLVTRHDGDIHADLAKAHICESMFSAIVEVEKGKTKSTCIHPGKNALYVDDSFAERMDVMHSLGIPAFGVESVEALLDYHQ